MKIVDKELLAFYEKLLSLHNELDNAFINDFSRSLPLNETLLDRWERAKKLGFGKGSSIYDSAMVIGQVEVGENVWIGPNSIIDGSGGLVIGNYSTISSGVQIYTHDNVKQTLSSGKMPIERLPVNIGKNVYVGPNSIITKNVTVGDFCVIAASSFINKNIPSNSIVMGQPGKIAGIVEFNNGLPEFKYYT